MALVKFRNPSCAEYATTQVERHLEELLAARKNYHLLAAEASLSGPQEMSIVRTTGSIGYPCGLAVSYGRTHVDREDTEARCANGADVFYVERAVSLLRETPRWEEISVVERREAWGHDPRHNRYVFTHTGNAEGSCDSDWVLDVMEHQFAIPYRFHFVNRNHVRDAKGRRPKIEKGTHLVVSADGILGLVDDIARYL